MGNRFSEDPNLFTISKSFDVSLRTVFDRLGFAIEILFKSWEGGQIEVLFFETSAQICHFVAAGSVALVTVAARVAIGIAVGIIVRVTA